MRRGRLSLRSRLAALYGGLFLVAGAVVLLVNTLLIAQNLPEAGPFVGEAKVGPPHATPEPAPPGLAKDVASTVTEYRDSTVQTLLVVSGIALLVTGTLAVLLGWLMAGRVLRPLHAVTATARRLEAGDLNRRINLDGPPGELKELADTFDGMLDRLATAFDSQRRFVDNASHELRTPLAVQRTLIEVAMADPEAGTDLRKLGNQLLLTNERSERMIEGLLVLARSDRGLAASAPVRLDEVAGTVLRSMSGLATEQRVKVASTLPRRTVPGDQVLLERLVTNLVHNAIHYNRPGGTVRVVLGAEPALVVENTGPPVPPEAVPRLFEPFRRLVGERTANATGAGLGLSIVRSVATAHHGAVRAEPGPDGGLRVTVTLPSAKRAAGDGERHEQDQHGEPGVAEHVDPTPSDRQ